MALEPSPSRAKAAPVWRDPREMGVRSLFGDEFVDYLEEKVIETGIKYAVKEVAPFFSPFVDPIISKHPGHKDVPW